MNLRKPTPTPEKETLFSQNDQGVITKVKYNHVERNYKIFVNGTEVMCCTTHADAELFLDIVLRSIYAVVE